jgi:hypothetical protein
VNTVKPVVKATDGFEIVEKGADVREIKAGGNASLEFKLKAVRPGEYKFNPLDVAYRDDKGNAYMKGGNEVMLRVGGVPREEVKPEVKAEKPAAGGMPIVTMDFIGPVKARVGEEAEVEGTLTNEGSLDVVGLRFIGNTTDEVEVLEVPGEMGSLAAGERRDVKIRVRAAGEGAFMVKPVELFYKDRQGKRYFKSSSELTVKAVKGN